MLNGLKSMVIQQALAGSLYGDRTTFDYSAESGRPIVGQMTTRLPGIVNSQVARLAPQSYLPIADNIAPPPLSHYGPPTPSLQPVLNPYTSSLEPRAAMWYEGYFPPTQSAGYLPYPNRYGMHQNRFVSSGAVADHSQRKNATRESTSTLKAWLNEHSKNPYPTKGEKVMLAVVSKMTLTQVSTWFANARRRLKKENKMTWIPKHRTNESSYTSNQNEAFVDQTFSASNSDVVSGATATHLRREGETKIAAESFKSLAGGISPLVPDSEMLSSTTRSPVTSSPPMFNSCAASATYSRNQWDDEVFVPPTTYESEVDLKITSDQRSPCGSATAGSCTSPQVAVSPAYLASTHGYTPTVQATTYSERNSVLPTASMFSINKPATHGDIGQQPPATVAYGSAFRDYSLTISHPVTQSSTNHWPSSQSVANNRARNVTHSATSEWVYQNNAHSPLQSQSTIGSLQSCSVASPQSGAFCHSQVPHHHQQLHSSDVGSPACSLNEAAVCNLTSFTGDAHPTFSSNVNASTIRPSPWAGAVKLSASANVSALPVW